MCEGSRREVKCAPCPDTEDTGVLLPGAAGAVAGAVAANGLVAVEELEWAQVNSVSVMVSAPWWWLRTRRYPCPDSCVMKRHDRRGSKAESEWHG